MTRVIALNFHAIKLHECMQDATIKREQVGLAVGGLKSACLPEKMVTAMAIISHGKSTCDSTSNGHVTPSSNHSTDKD